MATPNTRLPTLQRSSLAGRPVTAVRPRLARRAARSPAGATVVARATTKTETYVCIDCGYLYDGATAFDKLPSSYRCPVCSAPKRRFKPWEGLKGKNDDRSMQNRLTKLGSSSEPVGVDGDDSKTFLLAGVAAGLALGALYVVLSSQFN